MLTEVWKVIENLERERAKDKARYNSLMIRMGMLIVENRQLVRRIEALEKAHSPIPQVPTLPL